MYAFVLKLKSGKMTTFLIGWSNVVDPPKLPNTALASPRESLKTHTDNKNLIKTSFFDMETSEPLLSDTWCCCEYPQTCH